MEEFVEKLIERLEEKAKRLEEKAKKKWIALAERNGYERAIEIVNQLAEEYKGGWIPCSSDQKPKEGKFYNVTIFDGEEYRTEPAYYARIGYLGQRDKKAQWWTDCTSNAELIEEGYDEVIAWQPLPKPYYPKGE